MTQSGSNPKMMLIDKQVIDDNRMDEKLVLGIRNIRGEMDIPPEQTFSGIACVMRMPKTGTFTKTPSFLARLRVG